MTTLSDAFWQCSASFEAEGICTGYAVLFQFATMLSCLQVEPLHIHLSNVQLLLSHMRADMMHALY
jgi:hypothetical protein